MRITVNVDCTPEEARIFMGLPDVQPIQQAMMQEIQDRMSASIRMVSPDTMLSSWMPSGVPNAEQFQKLFWDNVSKAFSGTAAMVSFNGSKADAT